MIETEYIALARAVIIQAARDAAAGDREAAAWLADDETADLFFIAAGVRRSAVIAWLNKGCKLTGKIKRHERSRKPPAARKPKRTAQLAPAMG